MADDITVKIINSKRLGRRFAVFYRKLDNRTLIYKKAVILIHGWIQRNFKEDGGLAHPGKGWKSLRPETIWARQKGWGYYKPATIDPQILRHKGFLKSKWRQTYNRRHGKVESSVDYGLAHHEGKGNLPKRRILPTENQGDKLIKPLFGDWIRTSLK